MAQEKIIVKTSSYSANVSGGKVDSLRVKEDLKTVVRVYEDGKVGVAGRIGEGDDTALVKEAEAKLAQNIPYPCNLTENAKKSENDVKNIIPAADFVKAIKKLIARLNKTYPDFIFSNKINMDEREVSYSNSKNTGYGYAANSIDVSLVIKAKSSANIMDLSYGASKNYYNEDEIVEDIGKLLNVYSNKLAMPEEDVPVIISQYAVQYALAEMLAEKYMSGSSLFNGKLGEKIFDEKVNILTDRTPGNKRGAPFFDMEGTVTEDNKFYFVKDGVFCGIATNKRTAQAFNLPLSGGGYSEFDDVPSTSFIGVTFAETAKSIKDIVKGKAIYISVTSGGDMTPDGTLGLPVMLAYVYENGKLIGTLPEFGLSANIFDLLGKDFLGAVKDDVFKYADDNVIVGKFKINKS